jgi:hypothetical protein
MNDKQKRAHVAQMKTEAIEHILNTLTGQEKEKPSEEFPLGGLVHLSGVGAVKVEWFREELATRQTKGA